MAQGYNPGVPGYYSATPNQAYGPGGGRTWGAMFAGSSFSNSDFDNNVHALTSATMDPSQLGFVSGDLNQSTGVRFWGYAEAGSGAFNPNGMNYTTIRPNTAELRMVIWDSYAGNLDLSGDVVPEYPIHIRGSASGEIQGDQAWVRFTDKFGTVDLVGRFDSQVFSGYVAFSNKNGAAGYVGEFFIQTCSFFRCN